MSKLNSTGNNPNIQGIVNILLATPKNEDSFLEKDAERVVQLIEHLIPDENSDILLPYKDITDIIYKTQDNNSKFSDSLKGGFKDNVERIVNDKTSWNTDYRRKVLSCYDKIVEHIQLAITQKEFIEKITKQAFETATDAREIAQNAKATAEKAEQTYKSMFANYITILGIFTAITVTLFGGLNVINSLASIANQDQSSIIFMSALLVCCITLMLYFLANTVMWLTTDKKANLHKIFFGIFAGCVLTMLGFSGYKYCTKPTQTTEATHTEKNTEVAHIKETVETTTAEKNTNSVDDKK